MTTTTELSVPNSFELPAGLTPGTWAVDASHSSVGFVAPCKLMISAVDRYNSLSCDSLRP